jgi:hypothetical protein
MITTKVFEHVLELDLVIGSTVQTLNVGIEGINEANDDNPDPKLTELIKLHEKAIQSLQELYHVATDYITK